MKQLHLIGTVVGLVGVCICPMAKAVTAYGLTTGNQLITFDTATPGNISSAVAIQNLAGDNQLVGIDYWNGVIYGVGDGGHLYTLNPNTGSASSLPGQITVGALNGLTFGFDISPAGGRLVSDTGENIQINLSTGVGTAGPAVNSSGTPKVNGLAYNPQNGLFYGADSAGNTIGTFDPTTGAYTSIGATGIDFSRFNGFDIGSSGIAYLASPAASSGSQANLYTINLTTGAASLVGLIASPGDNILLQGLTVVPEPSTTVLALLGVATFFGVRRFRKAGC